MEKQPKRLSLYDLGSEYNALLDLASESDDETALSELFNKLDGDIDTKLDGIAHILTELNSDSDKLNIEIKRLQARQKTIDNNIDRLKSSLVSFMRNTEIEKKKTLLHSFSISKTSGSLNITNQDMIPHPYRSTQIVEIFDEDAIKKALKNGEAVEGAELIIKDSIRIY